MLQAQTDEIAEVLRSCGEFAKMKDVDFEGLLESCSAKAWSNAIDAVG